MFRFQNLALLSLFASVGALLLLTFHPSEILPAVAIAGSSFVLILALFAGHYGGIFSVPPIQVRWRHVVALALFGLAFPLTSCAKLNEVVQAANGITITQGQIDAARSTYIGVYLTPAQAYRCTGVNADKACIPRPICTSGQTFLKNQCATRDAIGKIQSTTAVLSKALNDLQAQYTAGNNTGLPAALAAFQNAVTTAAGLITSFESN